MYELSWAHADAARVTAAASLRTSEIARGGEREDRCKSPALRRPITTIELVGLQKKVKCMLWGFFCLFFLDIVTLISSWHLWSFTFPLPMTWWGSYKVLGVFLVLISLCMYFLTHGTSGNCTRQETCCINLLHSVLYLILFIGDQDTTNSLDTSTFPNWEQWKKNLCSQDRERGNGRVHSSVLILSPREPVLGPSDASVPAGYQVPGLVSNVFRW